MLAPILIYPHHRSDCGSLVFQQLKTWQPADGKHSAHYPSQWLLSILDTVSLEGSVAKMHGAEKNTLNSVGEDQIICVMTYLGSWGGSRRDMGLGERGGGGVAGGDQGQLEAFALLNNCFLSHLKGFFSFVSLFLPFILTCIFILTMGMDYTLCVCKCWFVFLALLYKLWALEKDIMQWGDASVVQSMFCREPRFLCFKIKTIKHDHTKRFEIWAINHFTYGASLPLVLCNMQKKMHTLKCRNSLGHICDCSHVCIWFHKNILRAESIKTALRVNYHAVQQRRVNRKKMRFPSCRWT